MSDDTPAYGYRAARRGSSGEQGLLEQLQSRLDSVERRMGFNAFEQGLLRRIEAIETVLTTLTTQGTQIMAEIDNLVQQVAETRGVEEAAVAAIQGLRDEINTLVANATELTDLKAQLTALTTQLDESEQPLAAAIANEPPPVEPPV